MNKSEEEANEDNSFVDTIRKDIDSTLLDVGKNKLTDADTTTSFSTYPGQAVSFFQNIAWYWWLFLVFILLFLVGNMLGFIQSGETGLINYYQNLFRTLYIRIMAFLRFENPGTIPDVKTDTQLTTTIKTDKGEFVSPPSFFSQNIDLTSGNGSLTSGRGTDDKNNDLQSSLSKSNNINKNNPKRKTTSYEADDSASTIQSSRPGGQSGWCYIGEDRGFRSCTKVNETDVCMSGNIFPSEDICMNTNLRP